MITETPYSVNVVIKKTLTTKFPNRYSKMSSGSPNPMTMQHTTKSAIAANIKAYTPKTNFLIQDPSSTHTMQHSIKSANRANSPVHIPQSDFLNQNPSLAHTTMQHTIKSANTAIGPFNIPQSDFLKQDPSSANTNQNTSKSIRKSQNHSATNIKQKNLRPRARDVPANSDTEKSDDQNNTEVEDYITMPSISTSNKFEALKLLNEDSKGETAASIDLKPKVLCPKIFPKSILAASSKINSDSAVLDSPSKNPYLYINSEGRAVVDSINLEQLRSALQLRSVFEEQQN